MELLQMTLHRQYFQEILDGTKTVEYRERTEYWARRLDDRGYTHIRFRNGYLPVVPEMVVELKRIKKTKTQYELHLGAIVSKKNIRLLR